MPFAENRKIWPERRFTTNFRIHLAFQTLEWPCRKMRNKCRPAHTRMWYGKYSSYTTGLGCTHDAIMRKRSHKCDRDRVGSLLFLFVWKIIDPCAQVLFFALFFLYFYFYFVHYYFVRLLRVSIWNIRKRETKEYPLYMRAAISTQTWIREFVPSSSVASPSEHTHRYHCTAYPFTLRRIVININSIPCHGDEGHSMLPF